MTARIVALGLAQNCSLYLPRFEELLTELRASGHLHAALVGENGSVDGTRPALMAMAGRIAEVELVDTAVMADAPIRLERMAIGRQMLLDAARHRTGHRTGQRTGDADLVLVLDLDNAITALSADMVRAAAHALAHDDTLFAVSAKSRPAYYDMYAYRDPTYDFNVATLYEKGGTISGFKRLWLSLRYVILPARRITARISERTFSSFNGACLYRASDYFAASYRAPHGATLCEHVVLNTMIHAASDKHILSDYTMSLTTPAEHRPSIVKTVTNSALFRLRAMMARLRTR